ncbi:MAG: tetratricopeptide repeat protein [Anaerolineae bacterium]|nr:tetratricopeptide repeat protein [Anaerolineae bacterium]
MLKDSSIKPSLKENIEKSLAEAYFRYGQHILFTETAKACELIQSAAQLRPEDPLYSYHAGLALHRYNKFEEAITWYREAMQRDPDYRRAYYPLALALAESGQDVSGDPVWNGLDEEQRTRLKELPGDDPVSQGLLSVSQGDWKKAEEMFTQGIQDQTMPPLARGLAHHYLGVTAIQQQNEQGALEHWQQARDCGLTTKANTHNLILLYLKRIEQALAAGNATEAASLITLYKESAPGAMPPDMEYTSQFTIGYNRALQGKWQEALEYWEPLKEIPGAQGRTAAANVAVAYEQLGELYEAAESWREFVRRRSKKESSDSWLPPEQVARLWSRIAVLYLQAGEPDEAAKTLQNALKYQPDDPTLLLAEAHCYIEQARYDAAENRVDKVLESSPQNGEALTLKATLAEIKPFWLAFLDDTIPGIEEWERVEQLDDETYAPIARQRLDELYEEDYKRKYSRGMDKAAAQAARKWLERDPQDQWRRARYVSSLIIAGKKKSEIEQEVDQIDLTNESALHQLIDACHIAEKDKEAKALIERADALNLLSPDFFTGVARCALRREQPQIAEAYIEEALRRAQDPEEIKHTKTNIGYIYMDNEREEQARACWESVLEEDRYFGPALQGVALFAAKEMEFKQARRYLTLAERWARENNDADLLASIEEGRRVIRQRQMLLWGY